MYQRAISPRSAPRLAMAAVTVVGRSVAVSKLMLACVGGTPSVLLIESTMQDRNHNRRTFVGRGASSARFLKNFCRSGRGCHPISAGRNRKSRSTPHHYTHLDRKSKANKTLLLICLAIHFCQPASLRGPLSGRRSAHNPIRFHGRTCRFHPALEQERMHKFVVATCHADFPQS